MVVVGAYWALHFWACFDYGKAKNEAKIEEDEQ
jgi:hypothetical protein